MKVLVTGGRDYADEQRVFSELDAIHTNTPITLLIAGGARGADTLAENWADARKVPKQIMPADWATHGKSAGPIRNREMLEQNPDLVVVFPGGRGTEHMSRIATQAGIKIKYVLRST